jgi:hypothetical protein
VSDDVVELGEVAAERRGIEAFERRMRSTSSSSS